MEIKLKLGTIILKDQYLGADLLDIFSDSIALRLHVPKTIELLTGIENNLAHKFRRYGDVFKGHY